MPDGYDVICIVAVPCPECDAQRGQPCKSLIVTIRNDGFTKRPHFFRRSAFDSWRSTHPVAFNRLAVQIAAKEEFDIMGLGC